MLPFAANSSGRADAVRSASALLTIFTSFYDDFDVIAVTSAQRLTGSSIAIELPTNSALPAQDDPHQSQIPAGDVDPGGPATRQQAIEPQWLNMKMPRQVLRDIHTESMCKARVPNLTVAVPKLDVSSLWC